MAVDEVKAALREMQDNLLCPIWSVVNRKSELARRLTKMWLLCVVWKLLPTPQSLFVLMSSASKYIKMIRTI